MDNTLTIRFAVLFGVLLYIFFLFYALWQIISGNIAFWYDPARDLLLALDNFKKPTLIGPPAGIPGIFYGPYWIWFLSIGLLYSKDPRIVAAVVLLVPYFTLFPYILWKIGKQWGAPTAVILGTLFYLHFSGYSTQLWNPHLAPLFVITGIYLLASVPFVKQSRMNRAMVALTGFIFGLVVNVHISFGIGVMAGLVVFFLVDGIGTVRMRKKKKGRRTAIKEYILSVGLFYIGVLISYFPFLAFEIRHGFQQVNAAIATILNPFATVGVWGLSDQLIAEHFAGVFLKLTGMNHYVLLLFAAVILFNIGHLLYNRQRVIISEFDRRIALLAIFVSVCSLTIYLTSKNPVWEYHFIGVEVLFLLLIGVLVSKLFFLRAASVIFIFYLFILHGPTVLSDFGRMTPLPGTLAAKEAVVHAVEIDAGGSNFTPVVFSPAIYTYDFDYLFLTKAGKDVAEKVSAIPVTDNPVYLIIPASDPGAMQDFINAQTRGITFEKISDRTLSDKTRIIKIIRTS